VDHMSGDPHRHRQLRQQLFCTPGLSLVVSWLVRLLFSATPLCFTMLAIWCPSSFTCFRLCSCTPSAIMLPR
jgi:hypothetical protein